MGVSEDTDLNHFALCLKDVDGFEQGEGYVQCRDPNGMTIVFQRSITHDVPEQKQKVSINTAISSALMPLVPYMKKVSRLP